MYYRKVFYMIVYNLHQNGITINKMQSKNICKQILLHLCMLFTKTITSNHISPNINNVKFSCTSLQFLSFFFF